MRERVRLTEEEHRQLALIERRLEADDPALARRLAWSPARRARLALALRSPRALGPLGWGATVLGAVLMIVAMPTVPVAIVGYLVMVGGSLALATRSGPVLRAWSRRITRWLTDSGRAPTP